MANDISDELICEEVEAQDGARALRTLLFGRMFSFPAANTPPFLFPVI